VQLGGALTISLLDGSAPVEYLLKFRWFDSKSG